MKVIIRILKYARPWRAAIIVSVFALLTLSGLQLLMPMVTRELLKRIAEPGLLKVTVIAWLAGVMMAVYVLRTFFQFLYDYVSHVAGLGLEYKMRQVTYDHVQNFSPKWFSDKATGQIVSRLHVDCGKFETLIAHSIPDLITSVVTFIGAISMLLYLNPVLTGFLCIPIPLIFISSILARKIRKRYVAAKALDSELAGDLTDNIQGMKEIQIFNRQKYESNKIGTTIGKAKNTWSQAIFWRALINPLVTLMYGVGNMTIILVGGIMAYHGHASAADITAFVLYLGTLYSPIAGLARIYEDTQDALTSGKRIFEILDTPTDIADKPDARDVGRLNGDIEFRDVSFKYQDGVDVVKGLSFVAPTNKMVALVGPTGAGKSTIAGLIARFFDIDTGAVTIDGVDIRDMTLQSLRGNISMVLQDVFLFNGTIGENIGYGKEGASAEEIANAAKMACIHDFIVTMPQAYDTVVGERGTRLSGGQKQRVALARAILRGSPILILDEATSAVDNETERNIQAAINQISGSRTMIVIAHRLSTIKHADQILYIENGVIKERGTYETLVKKGGAFAKLASKI
ncbi:MAG: ABC transporter ATP-binding protein/permease [Christensenellaceae bacterium]|nr:ABC transporter ATP-binding protein/permease [Christensenellaceae bacterium]